MFAIYFLIKMMHGPTQNTKKAYEKLKSHLLIYRLVNKIIFNLLLLPDSLVWHDQVL